MIDRGGDEVLLTRPECLMLVGRAERLIGGPSTLTSAIAAKVQFGTLEEAQRGIIELAEAFTPKGADE